MMHDTEQCSVCQAPTHGDRCVRCGQPVCIQHLPSEHERCWGCEGTYHDRRSGRGDRLAFWLPFGVVWLVFAIAAPTLLSWGFVGGTSMRSFSTGIPLLDAGILAALGSLGLGLAGRWIRDRTLRRRFLAE
jgi:hypothetical protein